MSGHSRQDQEKKESPFLAMACVGVFVLVIALFFGAVHAPNWIYGSVNTSDRNAIIGVLFSALAFGGVICALILQRSELKLQRLELAAQRMEQKRSQREFRRTAAAQEKAERTLRRQAEVLSDTARLNALGSLVLGLSQKAVLMKARQDDDTSVFAHDLGERCRLEIDLIRHRIRLNEALNSNAAD